MKKLHINSKYIGLLLTLLILTNCTKLLVAQAIQTDAQSASLMKRSKKLSLTSIEGPKIICKSAVYLIKNTNGSVQWSSSNPDLLIVDKNGAVTANGKNAGLATLRAAFRDIHNEPVYIDKTIEVAGSPASDFRISGDSTICQSCESKRYFKISYIKNNETNTASTIASTQTEWGIKFPGKDGIQTISIQSADSVSFPTIRKNIEKSYFQQSEETNSIGLVARMKNPCGWTEWTNQLNIKLLRTSNFYAYPNPSHGNFTIAQHQATSLVPDHLEIYDQKSMSKVKDIGIDTGNSLMPAQAKKIQVNVSGLSSGVYFLHIGSGGRKEIIRLLIK